jgi:RNA-directed DNA polymerase
MPDPPRFGPEGQNREARPDFRAHLEGTIAWVSHVQPARGARLASLFRRIEWANEQT